MGAGPKFEINMIHGVSLGIYIDTFPHQLAINISLIKFNIYFGFGKGYDEL